VGTILGMRGSSQAITPEMYYFRKNVYGKRRVIKANYVKDHFLPLLPKKYLPLIKVDLITNKS
jgi:hypothetical protein